jgi:hypothetical protein
LVLFLAHGSIELFRAASATTAFHLEKSCAHILLGEHPVSTRVPYDLEVVLHLTRGDGESRPFVKAERHATWRGMVDLDPG